MQKETVKILEKTIDKLMTVEEFKLKQINGEWIVGPMKWLVIILGANHQAKDLNK